MSSIETYRKQAKQLRRWHKERNYSVGAKVRQLERYRTLTDVEVLAMPLPLVLAQEIVAAEAGYSGWEELRAAAEHDRSPHRRSTADAVGGGGPRLKPAVPILFVSDVAAAANWFGGLGFMTDFLHGNPPFYGSVSRGGACLHLRLVARPNFAELAGREHSLILATIEVDDVKTLFDEMAARGIEFVQRLTRQVWGGLDFHVRDPDGNTISFVQYS
ncbi:glyoxalase/bleomycin resistance/extradiol dioxygenase family protein [Gordonia sp. TBRC 11910]|uniref:Glyoxalase/bleomycin resistance/extradiol dioxygenase family protein n=1 Tax=Gordonia asplenii TaxID=2725283 RepID=A0A848L091_9ACTN|nr:VOC family protein [Gordonia asplenii]NMO01891.1 glyoxalase/bleomycin resistance/extradiol dioxygenase family protein [Gordonia asplenii]